MLQRAASNAYSWWWASHVRTKQSKWLEQSLQDMEEKVGSMLKLIQEDGDSFAKRAEMYYKRRPELINFVQESFRAYRSLAERYDHISKELQNANTTIASVFPEQVQFAMEDEDDFSSPRVQKINASQNVANNVPKVPKYPSRDLKTLFTSASKKLQAKKSSQESKTTKAAPKSGLSKSEALEEIDKVQKEILALQTVKEFVRSSYESGLTKYWEIDHQIAELQERVCGLQDEFKVGKVIEDDEARTLMAEAALKSCEEALAQLQEKQEKSSKEARAEFRKVEDTRERLKSLKNKFLPDEQANDKDESAKTSGNLECLNREAGDLTQEKLEMEEFKEEIKEHFEVGFKESLSVTELAEKINELVSKVIGLETAVSSQTALIDQLKTETDDLQLQMKALEDDKAILLDGTNNLTDKLRGMEEKLNELQDINQNFENENNNLQICFTEARCSLGHLSEKLHTVKPDEEVEHMESLKEEESYVKVQTPEELETKENMPSPKYGSKNSGDMKETVGDDKSKKVVSISVTNRAEKAEEKVTISEKCGDPKTPDNVDNTEAHEVGEERDEELNWQKMLLNGLEDKEKILLQEYTSILRNYKDIKKKLSDVENKNRESLFETTVQLKELRSAIAKRDEEIQSLRQKLKLLQEKAGENKDSKEYNRSISILFDDQNPDPEVIEDSRGNGGVEEDAKFILIDQPHSLSPIEEKLRMNIDALLDENLDFWLRFSTSFHQVQKFKTGFQDLEAEISKLKEKESNKEGSSRARTDIKSDLRPIYAHLREVQTELTLWIEQSASLKAELQRRFSSLCKIQEEITEALKAGAEEEEMRFTSYEATKFQGEVLNMKQENKKVRDELQMGFDHVTALQLEIEKTLEKLNEEFGISGSKGDNPSQLRHSASRSRVPLRSFIFGTKAKKRSIFACMHHRKYNDLRSRLPM
ncbi:hypothetical protein C3L33_01852, partial [Rhododendron williamsianum]